MNPKDEMIYLLEHYYKGNYDTDTFVKEYNRIYNFKLQDSYLSLKESDLLRELSIITGRFSTNKEDIKIPNLYFSEKDVSKRATDIYLELFSK